MAETAIPGISGSFVGSSMAGRIRGFSCSISQAVNDATGFSTAGWQEVLGGLKSWGGSASGYLVYKETDSSPVLPGLPTAPQSITLTFITGCTITGSVFVSNIEMGHSIESNAAVSYDFTGTLGPTVTWDINAI